VAGVLRHHEADLSRRPWGKGCKTATLLVLGSYLFRKLDARIAAEAG
jgi:hypothetical protein